MMAATSNMQKLDVDNVAIFDETVVLAVA